MRLPAGVVSRTREVRAVRTSAAGPGPAPSPGVCLAVITAGAAGSADGPSIAVSRCADVDAASAAPCGRRGGALAGAAVCGIGQRGQAALLAPEATTTSFWLTNSLRPTSASSRP